MNLENWSDDRDRNAQQTLDVGEECLATADREPELAGSARFADDTPTGPDPGEQSRATPDELENQADLEGEPAAIPAEWDREARR